jgi:hypothetical protein
LEVAQEVHMTPPVRLALLIAGTWELLGPSLVSAQLFSTTWDEAVTLTADTEEESTLGLDSSLPQPLSGALSGTDYSVDGSIAFAPSGPPRATANLSGSYTSGVSSTLEGNALVHIVYHFQVREIAAPPVAIVGPIPVTVDAWGHVDVTGEPIMLARAYSRFSLYSPTDQLALREIEVWNLSALRSRNFHESVDLKTVAGVPFSVALTSIAAVELLDPESISQGTATASVDPAVIEIGEGTIPGTSESFRDYYEIEFGPGYWALDPAPVEPVTWGQLKTRYGR